MFVYTKVLNNDAWETIQPARKPSIESSVLGKIDPPEKISVGFYLCKSTTKYGYIDFGAMNGHEIDQAKQFEKYYKTFSFCVIHLWL